MGEYYIHLLDGKPAFFDGDQICSASESLSNARHHNILVPTIEQVREERSATFTYRKAHGLTNRIAITYLTVYTPEASE